MGRRREEDLAPDGSIGVNDDETGPAEYTSAGRGTYGGGAADVDGVAIVTGGRGGAPDCAAGVDCCAEGPAL